MTYQNPFTDERVKTKRFNVLVDPSRAREQATEEEAETDPLFHIPTDSYSIINPVDVYGPLEGVLREETIDGTPLGDVMFGEIRRYRGGGEAHMDIMFDGLEVRLPGRSGSNTMRSLTDKEVITLIGDVRNFRAWCEEILVQVELVTDDLFEFIPTPKTSTSTLSILNLRPKPAIFSPASPLS